MLHSNFPIMKNMFITKICDKLLSILRIEKMTVLMDIVFHPKNHKNDGNAKGESVEIKHRNRRGRNRKGLMVKVYCHGLNTNC